MTSYCDIDLWYRAIGLVCDTPTQYGEHFHKVLWRYNNNWWSYGPDKAQITHFWPLTSKCDLDLCHRVMGLVRDTPTHHYKHFDQVIWKCNNNFWSYSPDKVGRTHASTDAHTLKSCKLWRLCLAHHKQARQKSNPQVSAMLLRRHKNVKKKQQHSMATLTNFSRTVALTIQLFCLMSKLQIAYNKLVS